MQVTITYWLGASKVFAADILPARLELAREMGADVTFDTAQCQLKAEIMKVTEGVGIGRICEASGAAKMLNECFSYLRKVLITFVLIILFSLRTRGKVGKLT